MHNIPDTGPIQCSINLNSAKEYQFLFLTSYRKSTHMHAHMHAWTPLHIYSHFALFVCKLHITNLSNNLCTEIAYI